MEVLPTRHITEPQLLIGTESMRGGLVYTDFG